MNSNDKTIEIEKAISYIHGRIENQLETFATSLNIPSSELTTRMGALLLGVSSGQLLGFTNRMSTLSRTSGKTSKGSSKVEVAKRPHNNVSKQQKTYWSKMTPTQRKEEMARRIAKRK